MARSEGPGNRVGPARAVRLPAQVILASIVLLATPTSVHASSGSRVVVDLVGSGDVGATMTLLQGSFGDGFQADVVTLDQLVEVGDWPWVKSSTARLEPCSAEPMSSADIKAALAAAEEMITALDYDGALTALDLLDASLCASTEPLPKDVAYRIPYLQGIVHFYTGDQATARTSFQQAGEMADGLEWDINFSPEPQQAFLLGVGDAVQVLPSRLLLPQEGRPARVVVDGREVGPDVTAIEVRGQRHVVQFGPEAGPFAGVLLRIDTAGDVPLFGPESMLASLSASPDTELGSHAFAIVAAAAEEQGYAEVMVLNDTKWDHCWWVTTSDQVWTETALTAGTELRIVRRHRTAGGVLAGTGGALVVGGAVLAVTQFTAMGDMRPGMETHTSVYEMHIDDYNTRQRLAGVGIGVMVVGAAAMTSGILLLAKGKAIQAEIGVDPKLTFMASPQGTWLGMSWRF